jgi:inorganic pyrophosphatase
MIDGGKLDDKIIAIPFSDPTYKDVRSINELPAHIFDEIKHFFTVYKELENKQTAVKELFDRKDAIEIISKAIVDYDKLMESKK